MSSSSSFPSSSSSSSSSSSPSSSSLFSSFSQLGDSLLFHSRLSVEEIGVHTPALQKNCRSLSRQTSSRSRTLSKDSLSFSTRERGLDLPSSSYSSSFSSSSSSRESERDNCPSPSSSSPPSVSSSPHFSSSSSHLLPSSSSVSSSISSPSSMRGYAPPFLWYFSHRFSPLQSVKTSLSIPLSLLLLFLSFSLFFTSLISLFCSLSSSFSSSFSSSGLRPPSLGSSLSSSSSFPFFVSSVNTFLFSSFSSPLGETSTPVSVSLSSSSSSSFLLPLLLHVEASSSPSFSSSERPGEVKRREAEGEERKENEEGKTGENKKKTPLFPNQVESEDGGEFGFKAFLNFLREELHRRHEEEERRRDREETGDRKDQDIRDSQQGAKEDEEKEEEESSEAKEESSDPSSTDREKKGEPSHKIDTEEEEGETPDTDEEEEEGEEERRRREELLSSSSSSAAAGQESFSHEQHEEDSAERLRLGDRQKEGRGDTPSPRSSSSSADRRMKDREEEGDRQGEEKREDEKEGGKKTRERIRRKERPKMIDVFSHGMYLVEKYGRIAKAFSIFQECAEYDVRCQYEAGVYYFLGLPPLLDRNLTSTLMLWNAAALRGSAEAQYALSILHSNLYYLPHLPAFPSSKRISSSSPPSSSPSPSPPSSSSSSSPSPSPPSSPSSSPSDAVVGKEMFPRVSIDRTDYSVHVKRRRRSEERRDERAISEVEKEKRRGQEEEDGEEEDFDFSRIIRFSEMLQERHREEIAYEQSLWRRPFKVLSHLYFLFSTAFRSLFHSSSFPPSPSLDGFHSSLSSDRTSSASSSSSLDTGKKKEKGEEDEEDREVKRNRPSLLQSDGVDIDLPSLPNFASMPPLTSIHLYASSVASHPGALMSSAMKIKGGSVEHPLRQAQACTSAANYYLPYAKLVAEAYSSGIPQAPELIRLHSPTLAVNSQGQGISPSSSSSSSSSSSIFFSFFSSFSSSFVSYFSPSTISSLFSRLSSLLFSSSSAFDTRERDTRGGSSLDVPEEEDLRQASSSSSLSHARRDLVGEEEGFDIGEGRESFIDSLLTGKHLHGKDEEEENAEEEDLWSEERRKESNRGGGGQGGFSLNRLGEVFYPSYDILRDLAEEQGDTRMELALGKRFLFGVDGFPQDFKKAYKYLTLASSSSSSDEDLPEREEEEEEGGGGERSSKKKGGGRPSSNSHGEWRAEAESLLGYMHALGVGVDRSPHPRNITEATLHFLSAAAEHRHPIALNGLGYLHFFGSDYVEQNIQAAFHFFNASSSQNFPDAQNNLAALHLTGHGRSQSFIKAMQAYTKALHDGSTGAAYALGLMHLNGLGAVRDCSVATALLKRVCEKGAYVTRNLQKAYSLYEEGRFNDAAFHFLLLAEAGHEVAQTNLAYLFDTGLTDLFFDGSIAKQRLHAQRFYELAASQGSPLAELRLGDFAYYGYGVQRETRARYPSTRYVDDEGGDMGEWMSQSYDVFEKRIPNAKAAVGHYRAVVEMGSNSSAKWIIPYLAKASYNLGFMYMHGLGVVQDLSYAEHHFYQALEFDPSAPRAPVYVALLFLRLMKYRQDVNLLQVYEQLAQDQRIVLLFLILLLSLCFLLLRFFAKRLHAIQLHVLSSLPSHTNLQSRNRREDSATPYSPLTSSSSSPTLASSSSSSPTLASSSSSSSHSPPPTCVDHPVLLSREEPVESPLSPSISSSSSLGEKLPRAGEKSETRKQLTPTEEEEEKSSSSKLSSLSSVPHPDDHKEEKEKEEKGEDSSLLLTMNFSETAQAGKEEEEKNE